VILLDIDLGADNGFDLLDRLRDHAWPGVAPRIAMFTNSGDLAARSKAASAGADGYLVKADLRLPQFIFAVKTLLDPPASAEALQPAVASLAQP
jgi:DNA-binding response OmpR family regulator